MTTEADRELDAMMTGIIRDHEMHYHPFVKCSEVDGRCAVVVANERAALLRDVRAYLAVHRATNQHDHLAAGLSCGACELLEWIEGATSD